MSENKEDIEIMAENPAEACEDAQKAELPKAAARYVLKTGEAKGKVDLLSLDFEAMSAFILELGERVYRAKQIFHWLHRKHVTDFESMTNLSKSFRHKLSEQAAIITPTISDLKVSSDGTRKYQLTTHDDHVVEAVFIPNASGAGKNALCVSSQVGCAMGCKFCATAAIKLKRHLTPGEIAAQLYVVTEDVRANVELEHAPQNQPHPGVPDENGKLDKSPRPVTNIVYMGMGEPLHNFEGVVGSSRLICHDEGMGYSQRRLTVSTSGLVPAIAKLGKETDLQIAVSLNATTNDVRSIIMPVNRKWDIEDLLAACRGFPLKARRRITFEYVMLAGVNDTDDDAHRLVWMLRDLQCKVNLIPFNEHPLSPYARPSDRRVASFQRILEKGDLGTFVRTTRGLDIDAACGMLGAKKLEAERAGSLNVLQ